VSKEVHSSRVDFKIDDVGVIECETKSLALSKTTTDIYMVSSDGATQVYVSRLQSDYTNVWSK